MSALTPRRDDERRPAARRPMETGARRINALSSLPVFHRIKGRKAVVAGSGEAAYWKVELLAAAGADVAVFAGDAEQAAPFQALAAAVTAGRITVAARRWQSDDLHDAALAVADLPDDQIEAFRAAARSAGVPVNMIDRPEASDFQFGSIVNRSPLVISISTDGAAPVFAQSVRAKIESILPKGLSAWAEAARDWRDRVKAHALPFQARRRFWQRFSDLAWRDSGRAPTDADRDSLLATVGEDAQRPAGRVLLVGAGPGDPELVTLKGVRALQAATVVLYDDLVSAEVLDLARREARRVAVGKAGHGPSCRQDDINSEMVRLAQAGEVVVRLKGGDPLIFGRATEEMEACKAAGIPVEIVPGISAAQGAAAALGISLTERSHARRLQFITGHARGGELPEDVDWSAVADRSTTTVVYMPRATLDLLVKRAIAEGLDPKTPGLAIVSATCADQATVAGPVHRLPELVADLPARKPMLIILGQVADLDRDGGAALAELRRELALA